MALLWPCRKEGGLYGISPMIPDLNSGRMPLRVMNWFQKTLVLCRAKLHGKRATGIERLKQGAPEARRGRKGVKKIVAFQEERTMAKWVYSFGDGKAEGAADMRNLLGGQGS